MKKWVRLRVACLATSMVVGLSGLARAGDGSVGDFYHSKTLTFLIGAAPGAAYDIVGRVIASQLSRFIPGHPSIVVQNMPGAGSLNMMNYLYSGAPRDGTAFGLPLNGVLLENRLHIYSQAGGNIGFDVSKMSWLGSPIQEPQVMWVWHTVNAKSFADLRGGPAVTLGATSPTADNYLTPLLAKNLLGARLKIITGYNAVSDIFLAAQRGEVGGNSTPLSSITIGQRRDLDKGNIRLLVQFGSTRLRQIPNVPTAIELTDNPQTRRLLQIWALKFDSAYPIGLPPGVPPERVAALRSALKQLMSDPQFQASANSMGLNLDPIDGSEMSRLIEEFANAPSSDINRLRQALGKK
jgi:tripartite-type tricarboxylate transporter receptor subunit TctC